MSIRERLFTQSVERGDRLVYAARLPSIPGYTTGTQDVRDTDAYRVIFTDSSNGTEQSLTGLLTHTGTKTAQKFCFTNLRLKPMTGHPVLITSGLKELGSGTGSLEA